MEKEIAFNNIVEWQAARDKYEAGLRSSSAFAADCMNKCCGRNLDEAAADVESVVRFYLKEWEQRNPKPKEV